MYIPFANASMMKKTYIFHDKPTITSYPLFLIIPWTRPFLPHLWQQVGQRPKQVHDTFRWRVHGGENH